MFSMTSKKLHFIKLYRIRKLQLPVSLSTTERICIAWTEIVVLICTLHLNEATSVVKLALALGVDVDVLNKANKTATELASENCQAEVAKLIAEYKADGNIRNKIRSTTLDTAQYAADEDGKDRGVALLHAAAEEGNIDVVKSLLEQGSRYQPAQ